MAILWVHLKFIAGLFTNYTFNCLMSCECEEKGECVLHVFIFVFQAGVGDACKGMYFSVVSSLHEQHANSGFKQHLFHESR